MDDFVFRQNNYMANKIGNTAFIHDYIFPFKGNWRLLWVIQRYFRTSLPGLTLYKLFNIVLTSLEMLTGKTNLISKPSVLRIEATNICNLRCPRCSCGTGTDPRKKGFISIENFTMILKENSRNALIVRIDGNGEPMLHPEIFSIIRIAKSYGTAVTMSTNLNTGLSVKVEEFIDSGLDRLIISIDGCTQESYEKYRIGGNLEFVESTLLKLLAERRVKKKKHPFIEIQFLDWGYNHNEIGEMRRKVRLWGADKFQVIAPDWAVLNAKANPKKPKRCFWLWYVLSVDWELNYHSCTNAWTLPWPGLNMKDIPAGAFWNHPLMSEARKYNTGKSSVMISGDKGCHCSNCSDMLVVNRPQGYVCE